MRDVWQVAQAGSGGDGLIMPPFAELVLAATCGALIAGGIGVLGLLALAYFDGRMPDAEGSDARRHAGETFKF